MIELCGRTYEVPRRKTVVFCVDGCSPEYIDDARARGLMPRLAGALANGGFYARGLGQMPSFTNPNNVSIVTGTPPRVHGISGNYFFDRASGAEVPMNEARFLRVPTIFEAMERAGVRTLCVTAKDKLRALLGAVKDPAVRAPISLSAERAHEQTIPGDERPIPAIVGRKNPSIYDWDISHYAMEMGLALHARVGASLVYVSLTDYVQHKEAPGGPMANRFYARFDTLLGAYLDQGFVCGLTADHGMNDKTREGGSPDVRFLDDLLRAAGVEEFRVLLPITDPYVVHHGALGSYATIYHAPDAAEAVRKALTRVPGIEAVMTRAEAAARLDLPEDRIGDTVVLGDRSTVLGKSAELHDLSAVKQGLRSHGGLHERAVPLVVCQALRSDFPRAGLALTNADIFDLVLNGVS